ncbi:MAG: PilZ domain-containing protein [Pseudomonadota bacterium]
MSKPATATLPSFAELIANDVQGLRAVAAPDAFAPPARPSAPRISPDRLPPSASPVRASDPGAIATFVSALMPIAVTAAVNGSIFNAGHAAGGMRIASLAPLDGLVQDLKRTAASLRDAIDVPEHLIRVASVHLTLAAVNVTGIQTLNAERRAVNAKMWQSAARTWRDAADVVAELLVAADVLARTHDNELLHLSDALRSALAEVADGGTPCLEKSGAIVLPGLAERRRSHRYPADLAATLTINGAAYAVRVSDVASRGYGLKDTPNLEAGLRGELAIAGQPPRAIEVRWSRGGRAGLARLD